MPLGRGERASVSGLRFRVGALGITISGCVFGVLFQVVFSGEMYQATRGRVLYHSVSALVDLEFRLQVS